MSLSGLSQALTHEPSYTAIITQAGTDLKARLDEFLIGSPDGARPFFLQV